MLTAPQALVGLIGAASGLGGVEPGVALADHLVVLELERLIVPVITLRCEPLLDSGQGPVDFAVHPVLHLVEVAGDVVLHGVTH